MTVSLLRTPIGQARFGVVLRKYGIDLTAVRTALQLFGDGNRVQLSVHARRDIRRVLLR